MRTHIKEASKSALLAICKGNSPVTGEFPVQRASNAEIASIWWRHRADFALFLLFEWPQCRLGYFIVMWSCGQLLKFQRNRKKYWMKTIQDFIGNCYYQQKKPWTFCILIKSTGIWGFLMGHQLLVFQHFSIPMYGNYYTIAFEVHLTLPQCQMCGDQRIIPTNL